MHFFLESCNWNGFVLVARPILTYFPILNPRPVRSKAAIHGEK